MGKKLDVLLGRNFIKASKFRPLLNLAISRLAVLKHQRLARFSVARSDIVGLLNLGHHDRALLRVEQVIKEQNMLDVFAMIEGYCNLLVERIDLIDQEKECPDELKEAVSSILYASTRCGEFPELLEMRAVFTSRFGKDFAARAIELRNNCGVNLNMIQKLSTRKPPLENRLKMLKEIASENHITLQLDEASSSNSEEKMETEQNQHQQNNPEVSAVSGGSRTGGDHLSNFSEEIENMEGSARKYKDVADAAEAAFRSAAYAAAAAKAAVELSRSDDQNTPSPRKRSEVVVDDDDEELKSNLEENGSTGVEDQNVGMGFEKIHPVESEEEIAMPAGLNSEDSMEKGLSFDDESKNEQDGVVMISSANKGLESEKNCDTIMGEDVPGRDGGQLPQPQKKFPFRSHIGLKARLKAWKF